MRKHFNSTSPQLHFQKEQVSLLFNLFQSWCLFGLIDVLVEVRLFALAQLIFLLKFFSFLFRQLFG